MIKVRCPICAREMPGETADWPAFPFCSPRCRTIDLGRWLGEKYSLPASEDRTGPEAPEDQEPSQD